MIVTVSINKKVTYRKCNNLNPSTRTYNFKNAIILLNLVPYLFFSVPLLYCANLIYIGDSSQHFSFRDIVTPGQQ